MTINLKKPDLTEQKPRITVFGVGGGGGNAVNNMINAGLEGVDFVVANTDAQALAMSKAERVVQLGLSATQGLGAGSQPEIGYAAAEECIEEIMDHLSGVHMCFVTAGMGGGTGTGAAPVVARAAREKGILTVGVVTKPFHFEGQRRMRTADKGIEELQANVDTLIVIPNQNLFRIANDKTTFADAFSMADQVLYSGVACITDLMVKEGLINLDFADVRSVMREMGKAMMGTGEASGEGRALAAAEAAISNPLLDETSMQGSQGLLISITGGRDMTLFEVDEAATRIREEVDPDANIILGATFDEGLEGVIRVSVVATGIDGSAKQVSAPTAHIGTKPVVRPQTIAASAQPKADTAPVQQPTLSAVTPQAPQSTLRDTQFEDDIELALQADMSSASNTRDVDDWEDAAAAQRGVADMKPRSTLFKPTVAPIAPVATPRATPQQAPLQQSQPAPAQHAPSAQPRMPRIEEFSAPVQAEFRQQSAPVKPAASEDRNAVGLLRRLTTGLTRRDEPSLGDAPTASRPAAPREPTLREPRYEPAGQPSQDPSIYAPQRGAAHGNGQAQPKIAAANQTEDDLLEIPAFLRRHAN